MNAHSSLDAFPVASRPGTSASCAVDALLDVFLAGALSGQSQAWPQDWCDADMHARLASRALYHGIAGLLVNRVGATSDWPASAIARIRDQALAQGMWELRHRLVVVDLLDALAEADVEAIVLKGTALAYDLYADPAERCRGDTDILISPHRLERARQVLATRSFVRESESAGLFGNLHAQEIWSLTTADGYDHAVDLHWQVLNSPFLDRLMPYADCAAETRPVAALGSNARSLSRAWALVHACLHRAVHIANPYYVAGQAHYGGDRLIWLHDIRLIIDACGEDDWARLIQITRARSISALCLDAMRQARDLLGARVPPVVERQLAGGPNDQGVLRYLTQSGQFGRAWRDVRAIRGIAATARFAAAQVLPAPAVVRDRYPALEHRSLPWLYARRLADILVRRER